MTTHLNPNAGHSANAAADATCAKANGGKLLIYTGSQPANAGAAATGTLLATLSLSATAFGAAASGIATANAITSAAAAAGGVAGWFRVTEADGATGVFDGAVATSGAELTIPSTTITAGETINVTSLTYTQPV